METHGVQCAKTVLVRNVSFIARIRRRSDMDGTINVFLTTIHGLDHDLMQLLKTSDRKMVMYYCFELEWNFLKDRLSH